MLFTGMAVTSFAQQAKVIAFVNKATWCHVCQENGPRFVKEVMPMAMKNKNVKIVMNDVSDEKTTAASLPMLKKVDIEKFAKKNTATGMLYFIDSTSKKMIAKVSLAESTEKIKEVYMAALAKG